jgi:N6-L-threonylcarbamoyladenine synthase
LERKTNESMGAAIERYASNGNPLKYPFSIPLMNQNYIHRGCDFSYSGLKTAVDKQIKQIQNMSSLTYEIQCDLAASFQYIATEQLLHRIYNAIDYCKLQNISIQQLVMAGGVACNQYIQQRFQHEMKKFNISFLVPPRSHCTDNGVMIAWLGHSSTNISPQRFHPRWPVGNKINVELFRKSKRQMIKQQKMKNENIQKNTMNS